MFYLDDQSMIRHFGLIYIQRFELPELLYAIDPAYQRQGLTVEAAQQALVWGHETCGLSDFVCYTQPHNLASRGVMEKLGFQFQHDFMHADLPHVLYRLSI
jgi:RimJ/RimL family protein N-acetyltransferase